MTLKRIFEWTQVYHEKCYNMGREIGVWIMFHNVDLKSLSSLELDVYNYIISHPKQVQSLTIRELAQAAHVSTTTISRFCAKLNLSGFSELKYVIRDELHAEQRVYPEL
jgi:DNA-binding MurR/RpiR family transcriptional regulator